MCELSEYPGMTVNPNASFCSDCMECLDFFGPGASLSLLKANFKTPFSFLVEYSF